MIAEGHDLGEQIRRPDGEPEAHQPREGQPNADQITQQLNLMLANEIFRATETRSKLLRYSVLETLKAEASGDDTPLREHQVGYAVFPDYHPNSNTVRTNATLLRNDIKDYYKQYGTLDPVLIDVPRGAYRSAFSRRSQSAASESCRRGWLLLQHFRPNKWDDYTVGSLFETIAVLNPDFAEAREAVAEATLWDVFYTCTERATDRGTRLTMAYVSSHHALRLKPGSWRAHVVLAAIHCCRHAWRDAGQSFDAALAIAPSATINHAWYGAYLIAVGRHREALQLATARVRANPDNVPARLVLGLFLYATRHFEEALHVLGDILTLDPNHWLALFVTACVDLAQDNSLRAARRVDRAYRRTEDGSFRPNQVFIGFAYLCYLSSYTPDPSWVYTPTLEHYFVETAIGSHMNRMAAMPHYPSPSHERVRQDPSQTARIARKRLLDTLEIMTDYHRFIHRDGDHVDPEHWSRCRDIERHYDVEYWTPSQMALGYLALEMKDEAVKALAKAVDRGEPLAAWLHVLPLFDPLRDHIAFQDLIRKMNVPEGGSLL